VGGWVGGWVVGVRKSNFPIWGRSLVVDEEVPSEPREPPGWRKPRGEAGASVHLCIYASVHLLTGTHMPLHPAGHHQSRFCGLWGHLGRGPSAELSRSKMVELV